MEMTLEQLVHKVNNEKTGYLRKFSDVSRELMQLEIKLMEESEDYRKLIELRSTKKDLMNKVKKNNSRLYLADFWKLLGNY